MLKRIFMLALGCGSIAYAALSWALSPVHEAEYLDSEGRLVVVTTFDDGSISVTVAGAALSGADAIATMQRGGINLAVNPSGHIMGQDLSNGAVLKIKPHLVTNNLTGNVKQSSTSQQSTNKKSTSTDKTESESSTFVVVDALPSNTASGTGSETQRYYESATQRGASNMVVPQSESAR